MSQISDAAWKAFCERHPEMTDTERHEYEGVFEAEYPVYLEQAGGDEVMAFGLYTLQMVREAAAAAGMTEDTMMSLLIANTENPRRTLTAVLVARQWEQDHPKE